MCNCLATVRKRSGTIRFVDAVSVIVEYDGGETQTLHVRHGTAVALAPHAVGAPCVVTSRGDGNHTSYSIDIPRIQ